MEDKFEQSVDEVSVELMKEIKEVTKMGSAFANFPEPLFNAFNQRLAEKNKLEDRKINALEQKLHNELKIREKEIASDCKIKEQQIQGDCEDKKRKDEFAKQDNEENRKFIFKIVLIGVGLVVFIILLIIGFLIFLVYSGKDALTDTLIKIIVGGLSGGGIVTGLIALLSYAIKSLKNRESKNSEDTKKESVDK
jgi:hypothetical protein